MQLRTHTWLSLTAVPYICNSLPINTPSPRSLTFDTRLRNSAHLVQQLEKRDTILNVDTSIHQVLLTIPMSIANQDVELVVDTGSRTTWLYNGINNINHMLCESNSCLKSENGLTIHHDEDYSIQYAGHFGASGKWATGELSVGNSDKANFKFGLADQLDGFVSYSWSGFGYNSYNKDLNSIHILDALKSANAIDNRVFELRYDNSYDWGKEIMGTGSLTIGDYDHSKSYNFFPLDNENSPYYRIQAQSVHNNEGDRMNLRSTKLVGFDSGSTSSYLKSIYKDVILSQVTFDENLPGFFSCSKYKDFKITLQITDNFSLTVALTDLSWNKYQEDYDLCQLMIETLDDGDTSEIIFGQYYLKNFNTVFDIDNAQFGISTD